jgi:hypothetical protein
MSPSREKVKSVNKISRWRRSANSIPIPVRICKNGRIDCTNAVCVLQPETVTRCEKCRVVAGELRRKEARRLRKLRDLDK